MMHRAVRIACVAGLMLHLGAGALLAQVASADAGADQLYEQAERLRTGDGVLQNCALAAKTYAQAVQQGDARAMNALGALYFSGLGVQADAEAGARLIAQAAELGDPKHLHDYATILQNGSGLAADPEQAALVFGQAAAKGWVESAVSLGTLYLEGQGVQKDIPRAIELFEGPAEAGHARAQNNLGLIYVRGDGVAQDYERAAKFFAKAAEQGLSTALNNLGVMYQNGFGVEANEEHAAQLYRMAAEQSGDDASQIGLVFDQRLVAPDPSLVEGYLTAAKAGDPVAQFLLGYLLATDQDLADPVQAARLFEASAQSGLPAAMVNMGVLSFQGKGVLQDFSEGYKWLTLAAASGFSGAIALRDRLSGRMTAQQINAANERAQTEWARLSGKDQ